MSNNKNTLAYIDRITKLINLIYDYINTGRYQRSLIENYNTWNQICSSLWVIGDTLLALQSYISRRYPKDTGQKYLLTYGLMQVLFAQQDAVINLAECFGMKVDIGDLFRKIRNYRNISIGHPTKLKRREGVCYGYISRISLAKNGFTLIRTDEDLKNDQFINIDNKQLIHDQLNTIQELVSTLSSMLVEADKKYKEQFKEKQMARVFPASMDYCFEKIGEGIYSTGFGKAEFGLQMLLSVKDTYHKFKDMLSERNELGEYVEYDLGQYMYAIEKLEAYYKKIDNTMIEADARIYLFYIREEHKHFLTIATEIDAEYDKGTL